MQKYKKNKKLWYGWRKLAVKELNISYATVGLWYKEANPILINWLKEKIEARQIEQEIAENIKKQIESSPVTPIVETDNYIALHNAGEGLL